MDDSNIVKHLLHTLVTKVELSLSSPLVELVPESGQENKKHSLVPGVDISIDCGRKQVFDNIDYEQHVHHMSEDHQNTLYHWTSYMSVENRVPGNHLPDEKPQGRLEDMENGKFIPNRVEHLEQRNNYKVLVSKVLTQYIPCLNFLSAVTLKHIPHRHSEETSKATKMVCIVLNCIILYHRFIQPLIHKKQHFRTKQCTSVNITTVMLPLKWFPKPVHTSVIMNS